MPDRAARRRRESRLQFLDRHFFERPVCHRCAVPLERLALSVELSLIVGLALIQRSHGCPMYDHVWIEQEDDERLV